MPDSPIFAALFLSDVIPTSVTQVEEYGNPIPWTYETVLLPSNQETANNAILTTTLSMQFIGNTPVVNAAFQDSQGNVIESVNITPGGTGSEWDGTGAESTWGVTAWGGSLSRLSPWWLEWPGPVCFQQAQFVASGIAAIGFRIGNLYADYRELGYMQNQPTAAPPGSSPATGGVFSGDFSLEFN